jgi:dolichol-phosphate mannosyltransferase
LGREADRARQHLTARADAPLTVVVPVYNEGENLRDWWKAAMPHLPQDAIVRVVYDFEEDSTLPVARALAAAGAPIDLLRNTGRGVLQALVTGLRSARSGPVLVSMADLSDDLAVVPRMIEAYRGGADVVVASRYMPGGKHIGGPWLKAQLSRWGGRSLAWIARFPVRDATNNFRLYDAALVNAMRVESTGGFEIAFELTLKAWIAGARIVEVPATWRDRVRGQSRFDLARWLPLYGRLWARAVAHRLWGH